MTDRRARPPADATTRQYVEVELVEVGQVTPSRRAPSSTPAAGRAETERPPRRRAAWIVGAAVVLAGAATAVALSGGDDESAAPASTLLDTSEITTPPTLPALVSIAPATVPGTEPEPSTPDGGTVMQLPTEERFDPATVTVPEFPEVAVEPAVLDGGFDLLTAVAANAPDGTPTRTTIALEGVQTEGLFRATASLVVSSDPGARRDALDVEWNIGEPAEIVADRTTGTVYRTDTGTSGKWEQFTSERFIRGTGATTLDELLDAFATGPMTPGALAVAEIEPGDTLVRLDGGVFARPFRVTVPIGALRPYGVLLLANVVDDTVDDGEAPHEIAFDVYVTDNSRLALVTARFESDGTVFALEQVFDRRPASVSIDIPAPDDLLPTAPTATTAP